MAQGSVLYFFFWSPLSALKIRVYNAILRTDVTSICHFGWAKNGKRAGERVGVGELGILADFLLPGKPLIANWSEGSAAVGCH